MVSKFIHTIVLKSGDIHNDRPNDNGSNSAIEVVYNKKYKCLETFATSKFTPPHTNTVVVLIWDYYNIDSERILISSFKNIHFIPLKKMEHMKSAEGSCLSDMYEGSVKTV